MEIKSKALLRLIFELSGMLISPAGEYVEGSGHHHLLINQPYIAKGLTIPADSNHLHFGKGQKEIELNLTSGIYTAYPSVCRWLSSLVRRRS